MCVAARWRHALIDRLGTVKPGPSDPLTIRSEASMTQESKGPQPRPGHLPAPATKDPDTPKEKSEAAEVAGRHKNDGQKDHKGAR